MFIHTTIFRVFSLLASERVKFTRMNDEAAFLQSVRTINNKQNTERFSNTDRNFILLYLKR